MNTILLFDTETTGIDPKKDRVVEAAGCLWSIPHRSTIASFSFCVRRDENPAEPINHIPAALLRAEGIAPEEALGHLKTWFTKADAIVAHNAEFDAAFVGAELRQMKPWVCTKTDIVWPHSGLGKGLRDVAADHDVGVVRAHRAGADVDILARLFEAVGRCRVCACAQGQDHDVEAMLALAMRPKARFVANAPRDMNPVLKENGFRWDPDRKEWWRRMAIEDVAALPFETRQVAA